MPAKKKAITKKKVIKEVPIPRIHPWERDKPAMHYVLYIGKGYDKDVKIGVDGSLWFGNEKQLMNVLDYMNKHGKKFSKRTYILAGIAIGAVVGILLQWSRTF